MKLSRDIQYNNSRFEWHRGLDKIERKLIISEEQERLYIRMVHIAKTDQLSPKRDDINMTGQSAMEHHLLLVNESFR